MAKYCNLEFAREIQAVSDLPPCPITELKEAGVLRGYYHQLMSMAHCAQSIQAMHRQLQIMTLWACGLYIKAGKYNWPIRQKVRLLSDPKLRARVLAELGGERALQRWERLRAMMGKQPIITDASSRLSQTISDNEAATPYKPHNARTDSLGHCRLAPIGRRRKSNPPASTVRPFAKRVRRSYEKNYPPIPLLPHELRAPRLRGNLAAFKARYDYDRIPHNLTHHAEGPNAPPDPANPP